MEVFKVSGEYELNEVVPNKVTLLHLPYTAQTKILYGLTLKDILNLRVACSGTFDWVENSSDLKKRLSGKTIRLKKPKILKEFTSSVETLPFSRFEIKVDQESFNKDSALLLLNFARKFASCINHLKITKLYCCLRDEEYEFYNSLTSLISLEVNSIEYPFAYKAKRVTKFHPRVPQTFINTLESFKCEETVNTYYAYDILAECSQLKFIATPTFWNDKRRFVSPIPDLPRLMYNTVNNQDIMKLTEALELRNRNPRLMQNLGIEMSWNEDEMISWSSENETVASEFLTAVGLGGVKLFNASVLLVDLIHENRSEWDEETLKNVVQSIVNLRGICPHVQMCEMVNLSKLEFIMDEDRFLSIRHNCYVKDWINYESCGPVWPNLRKISGRISAWPKDNWKSADLLAMLNFLLRPSHKRESVEELSFNFPPGPTHLTPEYFTISFPNLRTLWLSVEYFKKWDYSRLFLLLGIHTRIRSLNLTSCVLLDDETFIGPPDGNSLPYFNRLKYLRHFNLYHYVFDRSCTCGISNMTLSRVFALMPLERLLINGRDLSQVSETGLKALADGEFSRNVCEFDIQLPCFIENGQPEGGRSPSKTRRCIEIQQIKKGVCEESLCVTLSGFLGLI